ncbi:hypothetical protein GCM10011487_41430 [Steroidobacter agaridevorans]|uniref:TIGR03016 family PEP-CTERM system-associated outer membrane protein n=1 Tax=Steroidobacter agaridevorans TaxID=2695856 RepID=A0A829YGW0_9GAMM|nr:hypothetical protein GCM10011487_41430 [Steroidobacter agaridevorans]GFE85469.1 hypothetical protein GCM10011488_04230 [Steroidobacter agaridevorans]
MGKGGPVDNRKNTRQVRAAVLAALPLLVVSGVSAAATLDYQLTAGGGHSDNIRRVAVDEESENIASAGVQFSLDQRSSRLYADLVGNFAYYDYLDDTFDDEVLGNFAGQARFAIAPERFEWLIADNFGQVLSDPFLPSTPENRENINYFTTGPDLLFALGSQTRLRFGGRYSMTAYEDTEVDSDTVLGEIELSRLLSSASSIGLVTRAQQIDYDNAALNADYDQGEAFLHYATEGSRTLLTMDAGYTRIERDAMDNTESGPLFRLDVTRRLTAATTASLSLAREFSSAGSDFASTQSQSIGLETAAGRQTAEPFTRESIGLNWTFTRNRTSLSLSGSWDDHTYDAQPALDQKLTSGTVAVRRDLSPVMSLILDGGYLRSAFEQQGGDYTEASGGLTFSWRLSSRVSINATYDHVDRDSDQQIGDYTENRYWFYIGYGRGVPRTTMLPHQFAVDAANPER